MESAEREIKKSNNEDNCSNLFYQHRSSFRKCDLPSEDDNDFRGKGEEFLILTGSKNQ